MTNRDLLWMMGWVKDLLHKNGSSVAIWETYAGDLSKKNKKIY